MINHVTSCIEACLLSVATCEQCATDCINDGNSSCALLCRDTADINALCARFDARESQFSRDLHAICARISKACAEECAKHADHRYSCKACAEACCNSAAICEELS